jgi:hypothetical protein
MDDKVKLTKCQNHDHHGGVFDTWTKWARPRPSGPKGQPASQALRLFGPSLGCHAST